MGNDHNSYFTIAKFKNLYPKRSDLLEHCSDKDRRVVNKAFFQSFICPGSSHTLLHFKDFYYYTTKNRLCQIKTKYLKRFIDDT